MVVNEFFKSIFRTLGRITAYIILGILAYLIFSWFGFESSKVKAETYPNASYIVFKYDSSFGPVCNNVTRCIPAANRLFNYSYVDYSNIDIKANTTYHYEFDMNIIMAIQINNPNVNIGRKITMYGTGLADNLDVTCDRNCVSTIEYNGTTTFDYGSSASGITRITGYMYAIHMSGEIDTTRSFNNIKFWAWDGMYIGGISSSSLIFSENEISSADSINQNANVNRDIILNNLRERFDSLMSNNFTNTQAIIDNGIFNTAQVTDKLENMYDATVELEDAITDETSASNILIQGVQGIVPSGPATQLLQLPFTMINSMYDGFNATCSAWNINTGPLLGNHVWTIPCINLARRLGSDVWSYQGFSLWQIIDIMGFIFMVYEIIMLMINGYNMIAELNDPWEILYVPQHGGFNTRSGRNYVEY